jgi:hypothetical protein
MVDAITKVTSSSRVTLPKTGGVSSDKEWGTQLKPSPSSTNQTSVKTIQIELERVPLNITNQNAALTPKQMAEHLSRELSRRTAQNKAVNPKNTRGISRINNDLSTILDENKDISSLLESGSPEDIAEFLAFFQSAMERHLAGFEFGEIIYNQELIDSIMKKY